MGSQILWTTAFRISTFCDGLFRYRCFDSSLWYHMATKLASPTRATVHVTLGSVQFCLLDKWGCLLFCFMEWDTPSVIYFILCSQKMSVSCQKKNTFHAFYAFWCSCNFYFWSSRSSWIQIGILRWKFIHEHLDCTVQSFLACTKFCSFHIIFGMTWFYRSFMDICNYKLVSVCIVISEALLVLL